MDDFIIDWHNNTSSGTLFTSSGHVIVYENQNNIDDKIEHGKIYGYLEPHQVTSLSQLLGKAQQDEVKQETGYTGYLFSDNHLVDEIIIPTSLVDEIQTLQYQLVT